MIQLKIKEPFQFPSGLYFKKGDVYWGYPEYISQLYRALPGEKSTGQEKTNLCIIFKEGFGNGLLIQKDFIEIV